MDKNLKMALIIGGIVLAVLVVVPSILGAVSGWGGYGYGMMGPGMMGPGMMGSGMMGGFGWMWLAPLLWIVIIGLIIWAVVALVRGLGASGDSSSAASRPDSSLEILKKRYARSEIDKEEYEEKKKDLVE